MLIDNFLLEHVGFLLVLDLTILLDNVGLIVRGDHSETLLLFALFYYIEHSFLLKLKVGGVGCGGLVAHVILEKL